MRRLKWFALWTLLGLAASAQLHCANQRFATDPPSWWQAFSTALPTWYLWGLFSPLVAWLARRFQVDRANFGRHFFIHLGASLDLALLHVGATVGVQSALHALRGEPYPFAQRLVDNFTLFFHWDVLIYWAILAVVHAWDYHHALEAREAPAPARSLERLLVADNGRSFFVRAADVEWIEAARNYVRLHARDRTHTVRATLAALETRLDPGRFRRVSRSAVINLDRVREVQPWFHGDAVVILESGARVTLSRRYRANVLDAPAP